MTEKKVGSRLRNGYFKKGVSGNPLGRPKQTEDIKKARIQDALEKNIVGIFFKVLDNAIAGDVEAARLVFELYGLADRISVSEPDVKVD